MDYKIISVESRKGGVGKTTAALNLSRLLTDNEYSVLLIDLDITGTNVSLSLDSLYWKDMVNKIQYHGNHANLLEIYNNYLGEGKIQTNWMLETDNSIGKDFLIKCSKINIIGSEIFKFNAESKSTELICNPSILFDELHAFWFVEFLQTLCNSFKTICEGKIAIILDNSPGFVGINPAIHEWLTDIGPDIGKFLTIASIDKQDLNSCNKAIENLHSLYSNKFDGAICYFEAKNNPQKSDFELNDSARNFYLRIASKQLNESNLYYHSENIQNNSYVNSPQHYQALIINKVPLYLREIFMNIDSYNNLVDDGVGETMRKLLVNGGEKRSNYFVDYDESIDYQFISPSLFRMKNVDSHNLSILKSHFTKLKNRTKNIQAETRNSHAPTDANNRNLFIEQRMLFYQEELNKLKKRLRKSHLFNIAKLIDTSWNPELITDALRSYLDEFYFEKQYIDNIVIDREELKDMIININEFYKEYMFKYSLNSRVNMEMFLLNQSFISVQYQLLLSNRYIGYSMRELVNAMRYILEFQMNKFFKRNIRDKKYKSARVFLINESLNKKKEEDEDFHVLVAKLKQYMIKEENILDFYMSFCKSQVRIIDIDSDFELLIEVLERVSCDSENENILLVPIVKDILERVIINKSTTNFRGKKEIARGFKSAIYMSQFQNILKGIISKWEM
ncbi:MAG: ParA family protein [Candidatus Tenebribacter davisii]|nr:ParA family protein [Candidatus Tenebribacter davisii]